MNIRVNNVQTITEALIEGLEQFSKDASPQLEQAVKDWGETAAKTAVATLNKPNWLLSQNILSKVKPYQDRAKIWAIAGFKQDGTDPRSPGIYGRYYEGGYYPDRRKPAAPKKFLRAGKQSAFPALRQEINKVLQERMVALAEVVRDYKKRQKETLK